MKFWKSLNNLIEETLPDWRDKFLPYKDLKKQLKQIYGDGDGNKRMKLSTGDENDSVAVAKEVVDFVKLCQEQIDKFNTFVVDKEEGYLIRIESCKVIRDDLVAAKDSSEELMNVGRDLVDLHGEMVLLLNYSALNYTGLVKILKKYDKLSGDLIRLPFIQKVLHEPFYKTDILNNLVKKCETMLDQLFSMNEQRSSQSASTNRNEQGTSPKSSTETKEKSSFRVPEELIDIENLENTYMKLTLSALKVLKEIRSRSSTTNMFSLPPMQPSKEMEDVWKKSPAVEQVAK